MSRYPLILIALLGFGPLVGLGQTPESKSSPDRTPGAVKPSPPLGLALEAVPDLLYEHLQIPNLKRGQGVVIQRITPDSPAAGSGLQAHDIVLSCNGTEVRDAAQFLRLVQTALPAKKARVSLVRAGKEMRVSLAFATPTAMGLPTFSKGVSKPDGPASLNVKAEPLEGGKLRITFSFYSEGKGKLDQVVCSGSLPEIQTQLHPE